MINSSWRRRAKTLAAGLVSVALLAPAANAQNKYILRYTTPLPQGAGAEKMTQLWAAEVSKRTNGQVVVEPHYVQSLAKATDTLQALGDGRADAGYLANVFFEKQMPLFAVAGIPFVTKNGPALASTMQDMYENNADFKAEFAKYKVKPLFFLPLPAAGAGLTSKVTSIDNLKGKRIRSYGYIAEAIKSVGANPVFLTSPEIFEGVQRKTIDGFLPLAWDQAVDNGLGKVAPNFFDAGTGQFAAVAIAVSSDALAKIPADLQAKMDEASRAVFPQLITLLTDNENKACENLKAQGGNMTVLSDDEIKKWDAKAKFSTYAETWAKNAKEAGLSESAITSFKSQYDRSLARFEGKLTYEPGQALCAKGR
jgi:TRAP-type C4-dicarboxylate transport system substrate-binding protein